MREHLDPARIKDTRDDSRTTACWWISCVLALLFISAPGKVTARPWSQESKRETARAGEAAKDGDRGSADSAAQEKGQQQKSTDRTGGHASSGSVNRDVATSDVLTSILQSPPKSSLFARGLGRVFGERTTQDPRLTYRQPILQNHEPPADFHSRQESGREHFFQQVKASLASSRSELRLEALSLSATAARILQDVEFRTYDGEKVEPSEFNGDVRTLPQVAFKERPFFELEEPKSLKKQSSEIVPLDLNPQFGPLAAMPSPSANFAGLSFGDAVTGGFAGAGWPPDINGDVGPSHYILAVNDAYAIYNKTGTLLASFTENSLWSGQGAGTPCAANNTGDPVVIYDQFGDRWILTNFAFAFSGGNPVSPFYQCFAVSKTNNPVTGGWWFYAVRMDPGGAGLPPVGTLNDYPKFGNWNDGCLYMSSNEFTMPAGTFAGTAIASLSKSAMESGAALTPAIGFINNTTDPFTMIPSNISGAKGSAFVPPSGTPNYFVSESQTAFAWEVRKFTPGANCGAGGSLGAVTNVSQTAYNFSFGISVPQPGTANLLDSLGDRLMQKVQYRRVGSAESLWVVHSVIPSAGSTIVPQWAQLDITGGTVAATPLQTQIYTPDTTIHRWMSAIAADHQGNMAIGYSTSNGTSPNFPSIAYSGRLVGDPANTLPQTETQLIAGLGSQTNNCGGAPCHRWGDYTAMSIDPADDCTFWYTDEYYDSAANGGTGNWHTRIGSFKFPGCSAPTEVKVKDFAADAFDDGRVLLKWSSGYEVDNLGYNVYREVNGRRTKVNPALIAGSALLAGPKVALTAGKSYAWSDQSAPDGRAKYWLEDLDLNGNSTFTGPVVIKAAKGKAASVEQSATLARLGMAEAQMSLGQGSHPAERSADEALFTPQAMQLQTNLAGQPAVKLTVRKEGWYRIGQKDLVAAGLNLGVDPRTLQLYVDGQPVPMIVNGEQDGKFDPADSVEFYGIGINNASTDEHVYWLAAGSGSGSRIKATRVSGGAPGPTSFSATVERKDRTLYFAALRNGDAENFFGPVVGDGGTDQSLTLTNLATSAASLATVAVTLQGVTIQPHQVAVILNGSNIGTMSFSGQASGSASFQIPQSKLLEGANTVRLLSQGGSSDISLVDAVRISYAHTFSADNNVLRPAVAAGQQVTMRGFTSTDIRVMDVTDPSNPSQLIGTVDAGKPGASVTVTAVGPGPRALLAFTGAAGLSPDAKANIPSSLRQPAPGSDYVMITTRDLTPSVTPLKSLRESQGLSVSLVDVEDIYDEFNFGNKSTQSIKDFLQFARDNWQRAPRFVLLAGDASLDPKGYLGYGRVDLVPTRFYDSAFMVTASDDWFVDFKGTGLPEMAIGRLPARTAAEAAAIVAKIVNYDKNAGANSVLLTSDLNDGFNFAAVNSSLRSLLPVGTQVQEALRGTVDDATLKAQILAAINQGQKLVNFEGHGSVSLWRGNILTSADTASMTNSQKLAVFVIMTCLNGYFADPTLDSLGEALLKAQGGGAAVWASSTLNSLAGQQVLNEEFYRLLFGGGSITVGEAAARAKVGVADPDVRRSWILLGDPAMRLK